MMELKGKRVLVVGLGKSGISAATFLESRGARVTVSDSKAQTELGKDIPALLDRGIVVETGAHGERTFRDQDLIVVSPGVPVDSPQLQQARAAGVKIIGEVELAARFLQGDILAITGSNGKTTTTSLVGEILAKAGRPTQVGGNIGRPVTDLIEGSNQDTWSVLEISSFQLETVDTFRPKIAVILNITPDHLDRHGDFATYAAAKARIFENQTADDFAILNANDATCVEIAQKIKSQIFWFGSLKSENAEAQKAVRAEQGSFVRAATIYWRSREGKEMEIMPTDEIALKGKHNLENVLAAVCAATLGGCTPEQIRKGVSEFRAVEHRLELVATLDGVAYYNDSKATNVDATIKALESFPANIHIILGGKDKGSDYTVLKPLLAKRVKGVYTIGAAAEKIESQVAGSAPIFRAETLERAVRSAADKATSGDVILLAPACASFDQFQNYEHRGRTFKELVHSLEAVDARGVKHG
ncbi:MAG TPA: UDP-N-acetylmuramoyl-L-alanine--D-glutamate ligase [Terriglobales bacterium]|nr:UDP-N-acetylmuramoyl-L-alanine--D-glutamate ligase [Terriglobales bacterium]